MIKKMMEKLCVMYRQPLYIKTPDEKGAMQDVPNLALIESFRWLEENIKPEFTSEFFNLVKESFEPTSSAPFPLPAHLKKIYDKWNVYRIPEGIPDRIGADRMLTAGPALENFINQESVPFETPEENKGFTLDQLVFDANTFPEKMLIQKYGLAVCGKLWHAQGQWADEKGRGIKDIQGHVFKVSDIEKLYNNAGGLYDGR